MTALPEILEARVLGVAPNASEPDENPSEMLEKRDEAMTQTGIDLYRNWTPPAPS
ncbi:MAG: hypothetical protein QXZ22_07605 [Sulfolobales archaeon]